MSVLDYFRPHQADKETQTKRILKLLKAKKTVANYELNKICYRYAARIHELRGDGYRIVSNHVGGSLWTFTYKGHEEDGVREFDRGD